MDQRRSKKLLLFKKKNRFNTFFRLKLIEFFKTKCLNDLFILLKKFMLETFVELVLIPYFHPR